MVTWNLRIDTQTLMHLKSHKIHTVHIMLINKQLKQPQHGSKETIELGKRRGPDMHHSSGESTVHTKQQLLTKIIVHKCRLWMFYFR